MLIDFISLQIEIDSNRGMLYIHDKNYGCSVVRICGLKRERQKGEKLSDSVDITFTDDQMLISKTNNIHYNKDGLILNGDKVIFPEE